MTGTTRSCVSFFHEQVPVSFHPSRRCGSGCKFAQCTFNIILQQHRNPLSGAKFTLH